jgi:hypothetical protein
MAVPEGETARWEFHPLVDLATALMAAYQGLYFERQIAGGTDCNWSLELRAADAEELTDWQRALLVTPWTVQRVYVPRDPHEPGGLPDAQGLPADAEGRVESGTEVVLEDGGERFHLEVVFDPRIGHHLVEELVPGTSGLRDSEEALAWARAVAAHRDGRDPQGGQGAGNGVPERERLSRRQLFRTLLGRG